MSRRVLDALTQTSGRAIGNHGLIMRWQAALAEMQAFAELPSARRRAVLHRFVGHVEQLHRRHTPVWSPSTIDRRARHPIDWDADGDDPLFRLIRWSDARPGGHRFLISLPRAEFMFG